MVQQGMTSAQRGRAAVKQMIAANKRQVEWFDSFINANVPVSGGLVTFNLSAGLDPGDTKGATVTRIILDFSLGQTSRGFDAAAHSSMGIYVVESDAAAAGAFSDVEDGNEQPGWLWRTRRRFDVPSGEGKPPWMWVKEDIKAQRKFLGEDFQLTLMLNNNGVSTLDVDGIVRVLIKRA